MMKVVTPSSGRASIAPPWASTTSRTTNRPSPRLEFSPVVATAAPRLNGSKIAASAPAGMAGPRLVTAKVTCCGLPSIETWTADPGRRT